MTERVVFFMRAYNDIDHLTPVIHHWLTTTDIPATVVMRGAHTLLHDYRLDLLRPFDQLTIHHILDLKAAFDGHPPPPSRAVVAMSKVRRRLGITAAPPDAPDWQTDPAFVAFLLDTLFQNAERGLVVFDWMANPTANRRFAEAVIAAARERGYGNVSLPHGDSPYYNRIFKHEHIDYHDDAHYAGNPMDVVVVPNPLTARRYTPFRDAAALRVLGSPRYNRTWMATLAPLLPTYHHPNYDGKLKAVLFLRNAVFPIFWAEVVQAIRLIAQFPDVCLVVKHHTRAGNRDGELAALATLDLPNVEIVYNDTHSGSLLAWADVALDLGTSISFEAIMTEKPLLSLDYLHANISTTAHYLPDTAMRCKDDLYDAITTLRHDPTHRHYTDAEREGFIAQMVEYPDGDVLPRYVALLRELLHA